MDLGLECKNVFENGSLKDKKETIIKSTSNLIWDEEKVYITRPKWLNTYIAGIKRLKSETNHIEPNSNCK